MSLVHINTWGDSLFAWGSEEGSCEQSQVAKDCGWKWTDEGVDSAIRGPEGQRHLGVDVIYQQTFIWITRMG